MDKVFEWWVFVKRDAATSFNIHGAYALDLPIARCPSGDVAAMVAAAVPGARFCCGYYPERLVGEGLRRRRGEG